MAVFENCSVLLELKTLPFKEKKKLKSAVTENGGNICFVVNKQCSLIVTSDVTALSSNRLRSVQKHQTPVVGVDYVFSCVDRGFLLPVDEYRLDTSSGVSPPLPLSSPKRSTPSHKASKVPTAKLAVEPIKCPSKPVSVTQRVKTPEESGNVPDKFRVYTETDSDVPTFPDEFQVAKYSIFQKTNSNTWCVLELQSHRGEKGWQYRVVRYWKDDIISKKAAVKDTLVFLSTSEEALEVYRSQRETLQDTAGLQLRNNLPQQARLLGSAPLQQLLLEEKLNTGSLSQEVGVFLELVWTEALSRLGDILPSIDKISLNDVSRVEGLLLQAQRKLKEGDHTELSSLLDEVYSLLPYLIRDRTPPDAKLLSQKLDLCQLIRDVLNVKETTLRSPSPSCLGKYRALRCSIEAVPPDTHEFKGVTALLQDSKVQVRQVLRVSRGVELQMFKSEVGNVKPLLHSTSPSNFVGVLSRGLLLPRVGVEHHGIERTDVGDLGSGIYFGDAFSTSLKYSKPSETDGSRLLLVCDVALGRCLDVHKRDNTLTEAPGGHDSVHGVRRTANTPSEFEDDEFVVYSPDQVKLKYVVQFSVKGDELKEFSPDVNTSAESSLPSSDRDEPGTSKNIKARELEDDGVENIKNPLEDVTAGLLDSSGQQLPLQAVHVKCKLMDLLSQVIIFQKYTNLSSVPIEAKYVFPLDDSAAVCGFEAFINGKHVVGQVKEKETARKEYKKAIEKGHGAYLMDQDAPDVFTISVGNLPPGATVLIKVTFVSELIVRDGSILFSLPGSVAPWQQSAALNQTTQVTVEKVCVTDEAREFSLDLSVEMPHEITDLKCITHKVKIKKTDCKAVVSVLPGEIMGQEGFQLSVTLSEVHLPRMWVEKHPDKDSQASMLVFYPDFEVSSSSACDEVVLLLDTSESMKGESLLTALKLALRVLKALDHHLRINVIFFGTDHTDAFLTAQPLDEVRQAAESFVKLHSPVGGSTELWRPLRALSLLPPSRGVRNLLLLSDGHIQNAELTLKLVRGNAQHSRLFTCGLSPTANRHMLRALAQAGGGAFEFFDTKTKHNWAEKVAQQVKRMASPGCSSVSVKWQQFNPAAPPPVQAPKQLHALFNDHHTLVYGFVPHCTQATLLGNLGGQELKTMVSTSELQKTRGTFLHKLTARALIRDYEDGSLDSNEAEHEGKKAELKRFIIELSREFSILSQFTSFVAIEERDSEQTEEGFTDIPKLIAEEDVDFLPYMGWISPQEAEKEKSGDRLVQCGLYEVASGSDWEDESEDEEETYTKKDEAEEDLDMYEFLCSTEMLESVETVKKSEKSGFKRRTAVIEDEKRAQDEDDSEESESDDDMGFGLDGVIMRKRAVVEDEEGEDDSEVSDNDMGFIDWGDECPVPVIGSLSEAISVSCQLDSWPMEEKAAESMDFMETPVCYSNSLRSRSRIVPPIIPIMGSAPPLPPPIILGEMKQQSLPSAAPPPPPPPRPTVLLFPPPPGSGPPPPPPPLSHWERTGLSHPPPPPSGPPPPPFIPLDLEHLDLDTLETDQPSLFGSSMDHFSYDRASTTMTSRTTSSCQSMKIPDAETQKRSRKCSSFSASKGFGAAAQQQSGFTFRSSVPQARRMAQGFPQHALKHRLMSFCPTSSSMEQDLLQGPPERASSKASVPTTSGLMGSVPQAQPMELNRHQDLTEIVDLCAFVPTQASSKASVPTTSGLMGSVPQAQPMEPNLRQELTERAHFNAFVPTPFGLMGSAPQFQPMEQNLLQGPPERASSKAFVPTTYMGSLPQAQPMALNLSQHLPERAGSKASVPTFGLMGSLPQQAQTMRHDLLQGPLEGGRSKAFVPTTFAFGGALPQAQPMEQDLLQGPPERASSKGIIKLFGLRQGRPMERGQSERARSNASVPTTFAFGGALPQAQPMEQDLLQGPPERASSKASVPTTSGLMGSAPQFQPMQQDCQVSVPTDFALRSCSLGSSLAQRTREGLRQYPLVRTTSSPSTPVEMPQPPVVTFKENLWSKGKKIRGREAPPSTTRIALQSTIARRASLIRSTDPEAPKRRWTKIFQMQHSEGYWELTTELGELLNVDVDLFANVFLKNKGIRSLGVRAHADILRLVATLLVLQLMRVEKLEEGRLLRTLFCLNESSQPRPERWAEVKRAVDWVCWADCQYPCVYSRLEFGLSWESSTRQLLGLEGLPPFSPLSGLSLQRTAAPLLVH